MTKIIEHFCKSMSKSLDQSSIHPNDKLVNIAPIKNVVKNTTKINAGKIRNIREIAKPKGLRFTRILFVTKSPLKKKNTFTETPPE